MSKHIYPYTYQITYLPTQQPYIGVRVANKVPATEDLWNIYFTSSDVVCLLLKQHGRDAFRIDWIREYQTREEAWAAEMILLQENDVVHNDHYLNRAIGGHCDMTGYKHSAKTKERLRVHATGRVITEETKRKLAITSARQTHTDETRKKISEANKGRVKTEEHRRKISKSLKGHVPWNKGIPRTEEHKKNLRNAWVKRRIRTADSAPIAQDSAQLPGME